MGSAPQPEHRPEAVKPQGFNLTLEQAFRAARQKSETLAIAEEGVGRTFGNLLEATGDAVGDVDFIFTDQRQDAPNRETASEDFASSGGSSSSTARTRSEG